MRYSGKKKHSFWDKELFLYFLNCFNFKFLSVWLNTQSGTIHASKTVQRLPWATLYTIKRSTPHYQPQKKLVNNSQQLKNPATVGVFIRELANGSGYVIGCNKTNIPDSYRPVRAIGPRRSPLYFLSPSRSVAVTYRSACHSPADFCNCRRSRRRPRVGRREPSRRVVITGVAFF